MTSLGYTTNAGAKHFIVFIFTHFLFFLILQVVRGFFYREKN